MKEKINGLSSEEVQERINDGKVNVTKKDNLKSDWRIIFDNVFTSRNARERSLRYRIMWEAHRESLNTPGRAVRKNILSARRLA